VKKAIILLSGGLDSTVVLAMALNEGLNCYALSFDYGQRHIVELQAAKTIALHYNVPHLIIKIDSAAFGQSSLVSSLAMPQNQTIQEIAEQGIPNTYVPARNTLFLAYALAQAELHDAQEIHFGANQLDGANYPDCHPTYFHAFQCLIDVATKQSIEKSAPRLITPLIRWGKAKIIQQGLTL
jgi:7-cyano-7-deazaguanine synthase